MLERSLSCGVHAGSLRQETWDGIDVGETMESKPFDYALLLVEDEKAVAVYIEKLLEHEYQTELQSESQSESQTGSRVRWKIDHCSNLQQAIFQLKNYSYDMVLLDLGLPDSQKLNTLKEVQRVETELPIVVLTGQSDHEQGLIAVDLGAQDYLLKEELSANNLAHRLECSLRRQELLNRSQAGLENDALTTLPNRKSLLRALRKNLNQSKKDNLTALLFLDLDHFKQLNDEQGHTVGDQYLLEMAYRLKNSLRSGDQAYRLGGDEFCILVHHLSDRLDILPVLNRLQMNLKTPFYIRDFMLEPSASIGVVVNEYTFSSPEEMIDAADLAMYQAKKYARGNYIIYSPEMKLQQSFQHRIHKKIHEISAPRDLDVQFQAITSLEAGQIYGCFAYPTCRGSLGQELSPLEFLNYAEGARALDEINQWVIPKIFTELRKHPASIEQNHLFLQISLQEWLSESFANFLIHEIQSSHCAPQNIFLGIQSAHLNNPRHNLQLLTQKMKLMKSHQIQIFIENYGAHEVPLNTIRQLPIDLVKINLNELDLHPVHSPKDRMFFQSMLDLCQFLSLQVLISGVNENETHELLRTLRCQLASGNYYFESLLASELSLIF